MANSDDSTPASAPRGNPNWKAGGPSPNPSGRRRAARWDGWQNVATAIGTASDKRMYGGVRLDVVSTITARNLWRGSDICARVVEQIPDEAVRRGWVIKMQDREVAEALEAKLESIPGPHFIGRGARRMVAHALKYQRAYGGAAIFPVINDSAGGLDVPLDKKRIRRIERYQLFEPRELFPIRWYMDPNHPKFGEPELWQLRPLSGMQSGPFVLIHESRLVIFPGARVTRQHMQGASPGWGDSVYTRALAPINDFELTYAAATTLTQDFSQLVIKLKDMADVVGTSPETVSGRLEFMNQVRSTLNALLVDSDDDVSRVVTPMTGLPEVMDRSANRVAMATNTPVTILMGQAPAGLNATGDADIRAFYATVDLERSAATPMVEQLIELELLSADGPTKGKEPDEWSIEWPPLWQPTEKEQAETRFLIAQADNIWCGQLGAISPDDVAQHWKGDTFSPEISIDWDKREAQQDLLAASDELPPGSVPASLMTGRLADLPGAIPGLLPVLGAAPIPPTASGEQTNANASGSTDQPDVASSGRGGGAPGTDEVANQPRAKKAAGDVPPPPVKGAGPVGKGGATPIGDDGKPEVGKVGTEAPPKKGVPAEKADTVETYNLDGYNPDQPRDERGRFGSGGGGSSASEARGREQAATSTPSEGRGARLTAQEHKMHTLMNAKTKPSDAHVLKQMNLSLGEGHAVANKIREKLGIHEGGNIRGTEVPEQQKPAAAPKPDTQSQFKRGGHYTAERQALHDEYTRAQTAHVPVSKEPTAYLTGGGPASGKTQALLNNPETKIPGHAHAAHVDPDSAKAVLPEYKEGVKSGDQAAAARVHEESSDMAKAASVSTLHAGKDLVLDTTGDSGIEKLHAKVETLRAHGAKKVIAHYATVDVNEAVRRAEARAAQTGRHVPTAVIRAAHRDVTNTVLGAIQRGTFDELHLWDTTGKTPKKIATYTRANGLQVHDQGAFAAFKRRGERYKKGRR